MIAANKLRLPIRLPDIVTRAREHFALTKLIQHTKTSYQPYIAQTRRQREAAYNMRYQVFTEELKLEPTNENRMQQDPFDEYSIISLLSVNDPFDYCGTLRIVEPYFDDQLLPIESHCIDAISDERYHPSLFQRDEICEISRLAIPLEFRRHRDFYRDAESFSSSSAIKGRVDGLPIAGICLYLSAAAIVINSGRKHAYVMVYPAMAKRLAAIGLHLKQIGDMVDFNGKRAPFYINANDIHKTLKSSYRSLFNAYLDYFSDVENV